MAAFVTGGCGCVGYHLVKGLVTDEDKQFRFGAVHVMTRNPTRNLVDGAHYHKGDVCSEERVKELLDRIQPIVIFHVASPTATKSTGNLQSYLRPNVGGTKNLLDYARSSNSVKAFVYTSSTAVYQGHIFHYVTEDAPLNTIRTKADGYSISKGVADQMVLDANGERGLKTTCLRISSVYGERDEQMIPGAMEGMDRWQIQIGDNDNLYDTSSVENITNIHLLAAKALLSEDHRPDPLRVDGEAFNVTDGQPLPFWDWVRLIWTTAGAQIKPEKIRVVPGWLVVHVASLVEWFYWILTLGQLTPTNFRKHRMQYLVSNRTFSIEKAKKRLGYQPVDTREKHVKEAVEWVLKNKEKSKE